MLVLTVLGGGSPYTLSFIDELAKILDPDSSLEIRLYGRNANTVQHIVSYASTRLSGTRSTAIGTTDLSTALSGARIVMNQIRYGGLEGREDDERFAEQLKVQPDETLGPCGLKAAIRIAPHVFQLSKRMLEYCPDAWLLNLTNPLSLSTAMFSQAGIYKAIGLCELPKVTHMQIAKVLNIQPHDLSWSYAGLNHRGFIYNLSTSGRNVLEEFLSRLDGSSFNGITPTQIRKLSAVPLKYWRLFNGGFVSEKGRARSLKNLSTDIFDELRQTPAKLPSSLQSRDTPWYRESVIPLVMDIISSVESEHVLTCRVEGESVAREFKSTVLNGAVLPHRVPPPSEPVQGWVDKLLIHETLSLRAALAPSPQNIRNALAADPLLPSGALNRACDLIHESCSL